MITDIQKASLSKRFAAGLLDMMMLIMLAVGFMWILLSAMPFDKYQTSFQEGLERYEQQYNVDFDADSNSLSEADKQRYEEAKEALNADQQIGKDFRMMMSLILLTTTFGILMAVGISEFIVPLLLKNGQTIGKKVFSIGLIRVDSVQIAPLQLFVRSILGKYTVEIMIPIYLIIMLMYGQIGLTGLLVLGGILITELIVLIVSKTNSLIHDILASTIVVDISSQMIFRTTDDLIAYKKKIQAEQAARSNY